MDWFTMLAIVVLVAAAALGGLLLAALLEILVSAAERARAWLSWRRAARALEREANRRLRDAVAMPAVRAAAYWRLTDRAIAGAARDGRPGTLCYEVWSESVDDAGDDQTRHVVRVYPTLEQAETLARALQRLSDGSHSSRRYDVLPRLLAVLDQDSRDTQSGGGAGGAGDTDAG